MKMDINDIDGLRELTKNAPNGTTHVDLNPEIYSHYLKRLDSQCQRSVSDWWHFRDSSSYVQGWSCIMYSELRQLGDVHSLTDVLKIIAQADKIVYLESKIETISNLPYSVSSDVSNEVLVYPATDVDLILDKSDFQWF